MPSYPLNTAGYPVYTNGRKIVRSPSGTLWAVYQASDGSYNQIYISYSTDNGQTWTEEQVTSGATNKYFPGIAIDSNGDVHVVYQYGSDEIKYIKRAGSWGTPETVVALSGAGYEAVPAIALDSSGVLHVAYVDYVTDFNAYYIKKSGGAWGSAELIATLFTGGGAYLDGSGVSIGVDASGNVHTVYSAKNRGTYTYAFQLCYRKRTTSWQTEELITDRDGTQERPVIAIDQSGDIHVGWIGEYIDDGVTNYAYRQNVGYCKRTSSWGSIEVVADVNNTQDFITVSIDKSNNIHAVWSGKGWGTYSSYNNIQYRKKTGGAWQSQVAITNSANDNNLPNLIHSFFPLSNSPYIGYVFLRSVGSNLYYEYSSDLDWGSSLPDTDFMLSTTKLLDYFAPYRVLSTVALESPLYAEKTYKLILNSGSVIPKIWRLNDEAGTVDEFTKHALPIAYSGVGPGYINAMLEIINNDKVFTSSRRLSKYPLSLENHLKQYNLDDKDAASELALSDFEDWLESIYEKNGKLYLNGIEITEKDWTGAVAVDTLQVPGIWDPQTETFEKLILISPYTVGELSRTFVCSSVTLNLQPVFSTVNLDHPCVYSSVNLLENGVTITPAADFVRSVVSLSGLYTEKTHQLSGVDEKDSFTLKIIPQENSNRLIGYIRMPSDTLATGSASYYIDFIILMDSGGHILSQMPFYSLFTDTLLPVGSKVVSEFYMLDDTTMAALLNVYKGSSHYDVAIGIYNTSFKLTEIRKNSLLDIVNITSKYDSGFTKNRCYFYDKDNNRIREADLNFNLTKAYTLAGYFGLGGISKYKEITLPLFVQSQVSFETYTITASFVKSSILLTEPKQNFIKAAPVLSLISQDFIRSSTELKEKSDESPYHLYSTANLAVLPADHYLMQSPVSLCAPLTELECLGIRQYDFNANSNPKALWFIPDNYLPEYKSQMGVNGWQSGQTVSKLSTVYYNDGYAVLLLKLTFVQQVPPFYYYKQELCIRKYDLSSNQVGSDISIAKSNDSDYRGIFLPYFLFMKNKFYLIFMNQYLDSARTAITSADFDAFWKGLLNTQDQGILCYDFDGNFVTGLKFDETSLNIDVRGAYGVNQFQKKIVSDGAELLIGVNHIEAYPQKIVKLNEFLLLSSSEIIPDPNEFGRGFEIRAANGLTIILSAPSSGDYHMIDYSGNHIMTCYPPEQATASSWYLHPYPDGQHPAISVNKNGDYVFSGRVVIGGTNYESEIVIHNGRTGQRLKVIIFTNSSDEELGEYHFHRIHRFVQSEVNLYDENIPKDINLLDWYNVDVGGIVI